MNTRGLTEIVILTVGLQLGILDSALFSLMVVMAIATTAMTGPLLRVIYPPRLVERDLADAERAALGGADKYRVLAVVGSEGDEAVVDLALDIAATRQPAQVIISSLVPQPRGGRLELGTGLGPDLLAMTGTMSRLHALAARAHAEGVEVSVYSQFSDDLPADLTRHVVAAEPDLVLLAQDVVLAPHDLMPSTVVCADDGPVPSTGVTLRQHGHGADASAALQVATRLALGRGLPLILVSDNARRDRGLVAELARLGVDARVGEPPDGALVISDSAEPGAHVVVTARRDDQVAGIDEWLPLVTAGRQS